ncbi:MAG TPA: aminotransferase class III-fold pyridoxal phosphate-dependent enzyme [Sporichthyaceae bacterium]|nr:aminotransferase class III-fold pyridoxal phosphate-dependent enzyme [Sporichthyaceae bacterium]
MADSHGQVSQLDFSDEIRQIYAETLGSKLVAISRMFGGQVERDSHGARLVTEDGQSFVNCAGYGVFLLGATHPHVVAAVVEQVQRHPLSGRLFIDSVSPRAAAALVRCAPAGLEKVYFANSGAEAVESALKLARINGYRRIVTTTNSYHGRTLGALSVSARPFYQEPFRPLLSDVVEIPFNDAAALDRALAGQPPSCFIVEPVQGEGGVIVPDPDYLTEVSRVCAARDCFFIVDEIATGLGRLGRMWGVSGQDVRPDVMVVGKALSGGVVPISAMVATSKAYAPFERDPLLHQSTYSGSPLATAAALAAIEAIELYDVVGNADRIGRRLLASFRKSAENAQEGVVRDIRGSGLLIGIEFTNPGHAGEMMLSLVEQGVIANHSLHNSCVIRFTPPAVIEESEIRLIEEAVRRGFGSAVAY